MSDTKKVLVAEKLAPEGVQLLKDAGFEVDLGQDWTPEEFMARVGEYQGLLIRSATKVTAEVIAAATSLEVVGRAGVGVDNVDLAEATKRGIVVVNAPASNVLTAAEHTVALIMACARNIPQAHAALKDGRWDRSKYGGVELAEKTLGIVGLGRIGFLVAERARGLAMRVLAYDPFVPAERFHELGLERADDIDTVYAESDFITIHLPKNQETIGFVDDAAFAKMKDGVRVINVARGGIVDEDAWARALESGKCAGGAVDVYPKEPTTESPLFAFDQMVCTPHLGASTKEAQLRAGTQTAEQVVLALSGKFAPNAVNVPLKLGEEADELMPMLPLCTTLGKLVKQLAAGTVESLDITYAGVIGRLDTRILTLSVLQGLVADTVEGEVNLVNVENIATERGIAARETRQPAAVDFMNLITVSTVAGGEALTVAGTTLGPRHRPRLVTVYGHDVDLEPVEHMAFVRTKAQVPGTFGRIGTKMGEFGINISQVAVGTSLEGEPEVMGLALGAPVSDAQLQEVVSAAGLLDAKRVEL